MGDFVLFKGHDPDHGDEPWRTDGTARGTALVRDINSGPFSAGAPTWGNSYPSEFTQVGGVWFFAACDEEHGPEVWRSDGTVEGTVLVADIYPGPGRYGPGSWRSVCLDNRMPSNLTEMGGILYFFTDHPDFGREVWRTDGTARGTSLLKDAQPGPEAPYTGGRPPEWPDEGDLVRVAETLFFRSGRILWKSDGTAEGTEPVADVLPLLLTPARSLLFFAGPDGLWKSDGTAEGTRLVKDVFIATSLRFDNRTSDMQAVDDLVFFVGSDLENGPELWRSDGTSPGTLLLRDIRPGSAASHPQSLTAVDGALFFTADDGSSGGQLWTSDGTPSGTARLTNLVPGIVRSSPQHPARYFGRASGVLLFEADDSVHGSELWGYPLGSGAR